MKAERNSEGKPPVIQTAHFFGWLSVQWVPQRLQRLGDVDIFIGHTFPYWSVKASGCRAQRYGTQVYEFSMEHFTKLSVKFFGCGLRLLHLSKICRYLEVKHPPILQ
jgi:hypothetical protein